MRAAALAGALVLLVSAPAGAKKLTEAECFGWSLGVAQVERERDYGTSREAYRAFQEHKIEIGLQRGYITATDADLARQWAERAYDAGEGVSVVNEFLDWCLSVARGHEA